jgi:hypothetical protein
MEKELGRRLEAEIVQTSQGDYMCGWSLFRVEKERKSFVLLGKSRHLCPEVHEDAEAAGKEDLRRKQRTPSEFCKLSEGTRRRRGSTIDTLSQEHMQGAATTALRLS